MYFTTFIGCGQIPVVFNQGSTVDILYIEMYSHWQEAREVAREVMPLTHSGLVTCSFDAGQHLASILDFYILYTVWTLAWAFRRVGRPPIFEPEKTCL